MEKEEITPSEWQIMEILWSGDTSYTSAEVFLKLQETSAMSQRMVRVLMNRLHQKGILTYTVDAHDSRVYHYQAAKPKEECIKEKSKRFINSYFSGSRTNAVAALLQNAALTDRQIHELEAILEQSKKQNKKQMKEQNKKPSQKER